MSELTRMFFDLVTVALIPFTAWVIREIYMLKVSVGKLETKCASIMQEEVRTAKTIDEVKEKLGKVAEGVAWIEGMLSERKAS